MAANGKNEQLRLGFLTAIEMPDKGYVGGLLVTNQSGRPLEFQCTAPVKANTTQEILYGPTLESFILGELIGGTLVEKAGVKPQLILTDREKILELRNFIDQPLAFVSANAESGSKPAAGDGIRLGRQIVRIHPAHEADRGALTRDAAVIPQDADLEEPFGRVREALQETLRSGALR